MKGLELISSINIKNLKWKQKIQLISKINNFSKFDRSNSLQLRIFLFGHWLYRDKHLCYISYYHFFKICVKCILECILQVFKTSLTYANTTQLCWSPVECQKDHWSIRYLLYRTSTSHITNGMGLNTVP